MRTPTDNAPVPHNLPALASITVLGTTVFGEERRHGRDHRADLEAFRAWLAQRHPGVRLAVRCRWRPEEHGRVGVDLDTAAPLASRPGMPLSGQDRSLHLERMRIEDAWREMVGWEGHIS